MRHFEVGTRVGTHPPNLTCSRLLPLIPQPLGPGLSPVFRRFYATGYLTLSRIAARLVTPIVAALQAPNLWAMLPQRVEQLDHTRPQLKPIIEVRDILNEILYPMF